MNAFNLKHFNDKYLHFHNVNVKVWLIVMDPLFYFAFKHWFSMDEKPIEIFRYSCIFIYKYFVNNNNNVLACYSAPFLVFVMFTQKVLNLFINFSTSSVYYSLLFRILLNAFIFNRKEWYLSGWWQCHPSLPTCSLVSFLGHTMFHNTV